MIHNVIIALGSNISKDNLALCRPLLDEYMKVDRASGVITTEAIGMQSAPYANQLLSGTTAETLDSLTRLTKNTESALGRKISIQQGKHSGQLTLEYYGAEDLERLSEALRNLRV